MSIVMSVPQNHHAADSPGDRPAGAVPQGGFPAGGFAPAGPMRCRPERLSDADRTWAISLHLCPFAFFAFAPLIFLPLVLWLICKNRHPFADDHGREVVNFHLSLGLYILLSFWTIIVPIALAILWIVSLIRGAVAASSGEYFRYPITIRFIS